MFVEFPVEDLKVVAEWQTSILENREAEKWSVLSEAAQEVFV